MYRECRWPNLAPRRELVSVLNAAAGAPHASISGSMGDK